MLRGLLTLPERGADDWGSGDFGASRGGRTHDGVDYAAVPGTPIASPTTGTVTKIGYCYSDDLHYRYVQITDDDKRMHRLLYVEPAPGMQRGDIVYEGSIVGRAQNIAARYDEKTKHMQNHVHYEIRIPDPDGDSYVCVDPRAER